MWGDRPINRLSYINLYFSWFHLIMLWELFGNLDVYLTYECLLGSLLRTDSTLNIWCWERIGTSNQGLNMFYVHIKCWRQGTICSLIVHFTKRCWEICNIEWDAFLPISQRFIHVRDTSSTSFLWRLWRVWLGMFGRREINSYLNTRCLVLVVGKYFFRVIWCSTVLD
jgi:hypothetical protein